MTSQSMTFLVAALFSGSALAQSSPIDIGSVADVKRAFAAQHANARSKVVHSIGSATVAANISDYFEKDGAVSISGTAVDTANSTFILKGTKKKLYGYLVNYDTMKAYEFTTNPAGKVMLTEVPITKIVPDLNPDFRDKRPQELIAATAVAHPVYSPMANRQAPHIGSYRGEDIRLLQSKPGSPWVFYLNITKVIRNGEPLNGVTKENMYRAWQSVADQFSMLDMNVTTDVNVYNAAKAANILRTGVINFVNRDGRSYAPLHSFGTTSAGTLFRNPSAGFDYGYGIGMTGAHEVGHQMGIDHDRGTPGGEYFEGIPAYQWGPIMGNYWFGASWQNQLFGWSKGEYASATNFEDDLHIMNVEESVPYRIDDNPTTKALNIATGGTFDASNNFGQIERTGDTDTFTFSTTSIATLNLRVDPLEYLRMLDVDVAIYNASNTLVAQSNLAVHRSAEFVNLTLPAGNYRIVVKGGAEGTPTNGFSNYSSLGFYGLKGSLIQ